MLITTLILFGFTTLNAQNVMNKNTCGAEGCHDSILKKSFIHSPVTDGCESCHEKNSGTHPSGNGSEFSLVESGSDLCGMCHDAEVTKKIAHQPFVEGKCLSCHSPHSSNVTALMSEETMKTTCDKCHSLDIDGSKFGHGPYMSDQCNSCHLGHQSDIKSLVTEEDPYLCFKCHLGKEEDLELANVHPAFEEGCLDCHSPHTAPAANMLLTSENELCFKCHDNVKDDVNIAKVVHAPLNQNGECVSCHSPHAGDLTNLIINDQPNLCFNCHSENISNKEKFIDIYDRLSKPYVHKPVYENPCTDCHLPHISENTNLLLGKFPKGNYTKPKIENFSMCFECHDSKKITNKVTTTDTNFRDGSKNLHSLHVMKKKAISCQSCHDMHGADNEHIIGNVVYFGKWEMPIGYKVTETGGTCLPGCHVQFSYDRDKK